MTEENQKLVANQMELTIQVNEQKNMDINSIDDPNEISFQISNTNGNQNRIINSSKYISPSPTPTRKRNNKRKFKNKVIKGGNKSLAAFIRNHTSQTLFNESNDLKYQYRCLRNLNERELLFSLKPTTKKNIDSIIYIKLGQLRNKKVEDYTIILDKNSMRFFIGSEKNKITNINFNNNNNDNNNINTIDEDNELKDDNIGETTLNDEPKIKKDLIQRVGTLNLKNDDDNWFYLSWKDDELIFNYGKLRKNKKNEQLINAKIVSDNIQWIGISSKGNSDYQIKMQGKLPKNIIKSWLYEHEAQKNAFKLIDNDGNQFIDYSELKTSYIHWTSSDISKFLSGIIATK